MRAYVVFLLTLLAYHQAYSQSTPRIRPVKLTKFYSGSLGGTQENDEWQYYSLDFSAQDELIQPDGTNTTLLDALPENWDLVIQLEQKGDQFSDPNLYVSYDKSLLPNLTSFSVRCSFYGEDFCVIGSKELKKKTEVIIGVYCDTECSFRLQVELSEELLLDTGRTYKLFFKAEQERIIKFRIPSDPNITTIQVQGINTNKFDKFNMIMTKGDVLPTSENALYLMPAWENGYVGKFTEDCFCFCRGCNYTMLISAEKEGYIQVSASVSGQVIDLNSATHSQGGIAEIYDSVLFYHSQCYNYTVTDPDMDLQIRLEAYAGDPNLYVNPLVMPTNLGLTPFNSRDHFDSEELVLTGQERKDANASVGAYYICVFGNTAATYKLTVKNNDHEIFLKSGLSESGYINENETQVFYYRDPILAHENTNVSFQMHVMVGKSRLRAKLCEVNFTDTLEDYREKCTMTTEEMLEDDPLEKTEAHIGSEDDPTNTTMCKLPSETEARNGQVSCVFVVGVIGLAPYQTHYSVMIKIHGEIHHTILKEGVPVFDEIEENSPVYYRVPISNPNITKVSFQLTTIHGDPDIFISTQTPTPTPYIFEKRSIRCGIFPEIVEYIKGENGSNKTLEGDYYITIYGYVQSTFSLVYYTEVEGDAKASTKIKLSTGQLQKGTILKAEDSKIYFFKLSNDMDREDIEVRLNSENGRFKYYLGTNFIPDQANFTQGGDERTPIFFTVNADEELELQTYYVRVYPLLFDFAGTNATHDSAGMAFVFSIGFYEQGAFYHLKEGVPQVGKLNQGEYDYFYVEFGDREAQYEITLTPHSGNPDLVLSLDPKNKFPDRKFNNFISENSLSADSIVIDEQMILNFESENDGSKVTGAYVGVYTNDEQPLTYSVLFTKKYEFTPILLTNGQLQSGSVDKNDSKVYYFKTGSQSPIFAQLTPKSGDPNLEIYIVTNLSQSMYQWLDYLAKEPDFESRESLDSDLIYLDPKDPKFRDKCGSSCILMIKVDGISYGETSHFTIQVSRDIMQLTDNVRIQDMVPADTGYKYYRFHKICEQCNLHITIEPLQLYQGMMLLVDVESNGTIQKLPTRTSNSLWSESIIQTTSLEISSADSKLSGNNQDFLIGVYSKTEASFRITVTTFSGLKKLYLGDSPDITLSSSQIQTFYFENWSNATVKIQYLFTNSSVISIYQPQIELEVLPWEGTKQLPTDSLSFLGSKWVNNRNTDPASDQKYNDVLTIEPSNKNFAFCVECYFVIRVQNMDEVDYSVKLFISQDDEQGNGFYSHLIFGKPATIKLQDYEKAVLAFDMSKEVTEENGLTFSLQYFTGKAKLSLQIDDIVYKLTEVYQGPIKVFVVSRQGYESFQVTGVLPATASYKLLIAADGDLHVNLLLSDKSGIQIIPDGLSQRIHMYSDSPKELRYFTYLPPSPKFSFVLNTKAFSFGINYSIMVKKMSSRDIFNLTQGEQLRSLQDEGIDLSFLDSKIHFQNGGKQWLHSIVDDQSYDYIFSVAKNGSQLDLFEVMPIELEQDEDTLIVIAEVNKGANKEANLELTLSGSEIQILQVGKVVRGHVSNHNYTQKIYEIFINPSSIDAPRSTDLHIEVTPCNGRVNFFVSDDYTSLFSDQKQAGFLDFVTQQPRAGSFGRLTSRVPQAARFKHIYVGITNANKLYDEIKTQVDSFFEVKAVYVPSGQVGEDFTFDTTQAKGGLQVIFAGEEGNKGKEDDVIIKWSQIFENQVGYKNPNSLFISGQTYKEVAQERIIFQLYAGLTEKSILSMNSMCAIQHADQGELFAIYISQEDEKDREVRISRNDLKGVKVLGVLATVKDPKTHEIVNLAYEPFVLQGAQKLRGFGVRLRGYQIAILSTIIVAMLMCLVLFICCMRKRGQVMLRKLTQPHYSSQVDESTSRI